MTWKGDQEEGLLEQVARPPNPGGAEQSMIQTMIFPEAEIERMSTTRRTTFWHLVTKTLRKGRKAMMMKTRKRYLMMRVRGMNQKLRSRRYPSRKKLAMQMQMRRQIWTMMKLLLHQLSMNLRVEAESGTLSRMMMTNKISWEEIFAWINKSRRATRSLISFRDFAIKKIPALHVWSFHEL